MKNIIVVGAGKGIGLATVKSLMNENNVIAISRHVTDELNSLNLSTIEFDTTTSNYDELNSLPDEIHGLVYCPGSINLKPFHRLSEDDFMNDFQQNVIGAVKMIQQVLPALKKANGASVVLYSTVASKLGMPFHASVAASKSAIEGLAKSLAAELALANIRVNVIAPSLTDTPLAQGLLNTPEKKEASVKRHPLQRIGIPEEIASLTSFLLSDHSSWITGQVIGQDGGMGSVKV